MKIDFPVYDFPAKLFDFKNGKELEFSDYRRLEAYLQSLLISQNVNKLVDGLSNVLFWGYYRTGYGVVRVERFRDNVTVNQLKKFSDLVLTGKLNPLAIKDIGMPQFSGFSFVSKILMFLDPERFVILDKKSCRFRNPDFKNFTGGLF
jgi:hypothetical protein